MQLSQSHLHELQAKHLSGVLLKIDFEKAYDKVNWEFMKEVLVLKGFPDKWCDWVMQAVEGGYVSMSTVNRGVFWDF
jgi:hypothetical protein